VSLFSQAELRAPVERLAAIEAEQVLANIAALAEGRTPPHPGRTAQLAP